MQTKLEIHPIQESSTFNSRHSKILVKLLHNGVDSEYANLPTLTKRNLIQTVPCHNMPKDNPTLSITDSVHNLDVTVENGIAHEHTVISSGV